MANPWFKFYGIEYLGDQKIAGLTACERSCWLTLLSYASSANGQVKYVSEEKLMTNSGVDFTKEEWKKTKGVLKHFKKLGMVTLNNGEITVLNWKKRQETMLTNAQRQARFRERNKEVTQSNAEVTLDKNREEVDKNREDLNSPQTANLIPSKENYLEKLKGRSSKPSRISSSLQLLAAEISEWSAGRMKIGMLMKLGKTKGEQFLRECWAYAKDSKADDQVGLMLWKYAQVKIKTN